MISAIYTFRIRYGETDKMGFVYYGNYAEFFEVGRVELFRAIGVSYKELEEDGVLMPVLHLQVDYLKSIGYDEEISLKTTLSKIEGLRIYFDYEIYNENEQLCTKGKTTLIFINKDSGKPIPVPEDILEKIKSA